MRFPTSGIGRDLLTVDQYSARCGQALTEPVDSLLSHASGMVAEIVIQRLAGGNPVLDSPINLVWFRFDAGRGMIFVNTRRDKARDGKHFIDVAFQPAVKIVSDLAGEAEVDLIDDR